MIEQIEKPTEKAVMVNARVRESDRELIKDYARKYANGNISNFIREAVNRYMKQLDAA